MLCSKCVYFLTHYTPEYVTQSGPEAKEYRLMPTTLSVASRRTTSGFLQCLAETDPTVPALKFAQVHRLALVLAPLQTLDS
jgi:hypothetical protein